LTTYRHRIVRCNTETAHIYRAIAGECSAKGRLMQQNDMWIASLARQYGLTLLTQDSDFTRVSNLDYELWPRP
ncbi:MAG: PIN domain-containing protein, partial [Ktedonobacterales bacterium]